MISRTAGCQVFSGPVSLGPEERNDMFACVFQSRILLCLFLMMAWTVLTVTGCPAQSHGLEETTGSDPFPHKARIRYAQGFTVEYHPTHKRLHVLSPWRAARVTFSYTLVPRGQKPSVVSPADMIIEVPVERLALVSTSNLAYFAMLHLEESLVGIARCRRVCTPEIVERIRQGHIAEIGAGNSGMVTKLNMERLYALQPDVVLVYGTGTPEYDHHPKLLEAGFRPVMDAAYMEPTPLGRAEWIKFLAVLFNKEEEAERIFDGIARNYEELARKASSVPVRPTVFHGTAYKNLWYMPGGDSYAARFYADAGATYLWADDSTRGSMALSVETVLNRARDAEFWLNPGTCRSLRELKRTDERYGLFRAFRTGKIYNNDARVGPGDANDFWETGTARPDLVLADLIHIFHPELAPSHEPAWYRKLPGLPEEAP